VSQFKRVIDSQILCSHRMGQQESLAARSFRDDDEAMMREFSVSASDQDRGRALHLFEQHGFFLMREALESRICDGLYEFCASNMDKWCASDFNNRRPGHWSMYHEAWWESDAMWSALEQAPLISTTSALIGDEWNRWHLTKLAGDCVSPLSKEDQEMHSDSCGLLNLRYSRDWEMASSSNSMPGYTVSGFEACPALGISLCCHDITPEMAPLGIVSKQVHTAVASLVGNNPEAVSSFIMKCACPKGWAIFRDIRVWHCGTANFTDSIRYLPGFVACSNAMVNVGYGTDDRYIPLRCLPRHRYDALASDSLIKPHLDYVYSFF
jgi:hypothetical protein